MEKEDFFKRKNVSEIRKTSELSVCQSIMQYYGPGSDVRLCFYIARNVKGRYNEENGYYEDER